MDNGYAMNYHPDSVRDYAAAIAVWIKEAHTHALIPEDCAVVVRGVSGVSAGFAALALGIVNFPLVLCRKEGEDTHGGPLEGPGTWAGRAYVPNSYIVLDDFVSSGATVAAVRASMAEGVPGAEFLGVLEYRRHGVRPFESETYGTFTRWGCRDRE